MLPSARKGEECLCPAHGLGVVDKSAAGSVETNGRGQARGGDATQCTGGPIDFLVTGSGSVTVNSQPAARMSDKTMHRGLVVLGFPSNEFGGQDPASDGEIASFCQLNYGVSFPMMGKVKVNGSEAHPLWKWLTTEAPGFLGSKAVKWNFTKFLVGRDGHVLKRYAPTDKPGSIDADIAAALAEAA